MVKTKRPKARGPLGIAPSLPGGAEGSTAGRSPPPPPVEKRATTRFVPKVVFRTTFTGVVPMCVAVACGPLTGGGVAAMGFWPDGGNPSVANMAFGPDGGQSTGPGAGSVAAVGFGLDGGNLSVANMAFGPDGSGTSVASMAFAPDAGSFDGVVTTAFGPDGGNLRVANMAFVPDGGGTDAPPPCEGPGCLSVANMAFGPDGGGHDAGEHNKFVVASIGFGPDAANMGVACIGFNGKPCGPPEPEADAHADLFGDAALDESPPAHGDAHDDDAH